MFAKHNHSEKSIIEWLNKKYIKNSHYQVPNIHFFAWESDYFLTKDNGYCYEIEIKISRADFFKDKEKKQKHEILKSGGKFQKKLFGRIVQYKAPNKFFYIVPEGLVSVHEIPPYSGLMYINDQGVIKTIKEAPFITKEKLEFEAHLCRKFYYYWLNANAEVKRLSKLLDKKSVKK